jgi:hypothetical protein
VSWKKRRMTSMKRCMAWAPPPLARTSSIPVSRSSTKPKTWAAASRSRVVAGTATWRSATMTATSASVNTVRARPIQGFSSHSTTRMPTSSSRPPDHPHRELGEEVGEGGDVAVDALDHLAGGAGGVEGHVEPQAVLDEVAAQEVRGGPADGGAEDGGGAAQHLGAEGDGEEDTRQAVSSAPPASGMLPAATPVAVSMKRRNTCGTSNCRPMPASRSSASSAATPAWGAR